MPAAIGTERFLFIGVASLLHAKAIGTPLTTDSIMVEVDWRQKKCGVAPACPPHATAEELRAEKLKPDPDAGVELTSCCYGQRAPPPPWLLAIFPKEDRHVTVTRNR